MVEQNRSSQEPIPQEPIPEQVSFTFAEVASHLHLSPDTLQRLSRRFARYLGVRVDEEEEPRFTSADVAALVTVQKLLAQGYDDEQISRYLTPPLQVDGANLPARSVASLAVGAQEFPEAVNNLLNTIARSQQAVLNGQSAVRDMLGVVVQDNFNLKDENRKLRERMLELERVLAEYQRREETRKERMESRLRALESTVAALQQQVAQLVQLQRQQRRRRGWFG